MTPAEHKLKQLARARAAQRLIKDASRAIECLVTALSIGLQTPVETDVNAAHRRAHRPGHPSRIDADPELRAFVSARLDTLTFDQTATDIAAHFPPNRRVSRSSIHRWWQKSRGY